MGFIIRFALVLLPLLGVAMANRREEHEQRSTSSNSSITTSDPSPSLTSLPSTTTTTTLNSTLSTNATTSSIPDTTPTIAAPVKGTDEADLAAIAEEVKKCHRLHPGNSSDPDNGPFCTPQDKQNVTVGSTYPLIWDPNFFVTDSNNTVQLSFFDTTANVTTVSNSQGYALIKMEINYLNSSDHIAITIHVLSHSTSLTTSNLTLNLIRENSTIHSTPAKDKPSKLGVSVGIPIVLAFIVGAFLLFCCLKKNRRNAVGGMLGRRKGYLTGQSRAQRVGRVSAGGSPPRDDRSVGGDPFRDEPERGVELQDRGGRPGHRGGDDGLGELGDSPTQEGFEGRGRGRGGTNAFRDEISRQRSEDHDAWR